MYDIAYNLPEIWFNLCLCSLGVIVVNRLVLNFSYTANHRDDSAYQIQAGAFASNRFLGNIDLLASSGLVGDCDEDLDDTDEADEGFHFLTGVDQGNL